MVSIELKTKGRAKIRKLPEVIELSDSDNVQTLANSISKSVGLSVHRLRLTIANPEASAESDKKKKDIALSFDSPISKYSNGSEPLVVTVKDLGPQLGWRTVYLVEYLGPILIHPIFYFGQKAIYGQTFEHSRVQQLCFLFAILHFVKREVETAFVHKFSLATMPAFNIFKNSGHYWILSGFNLAYFIYSPPSYVSDDKSLASKIIFGRNVVPLSANQLHFLTAFWIFAELSNFWTHLNLASLRADGSKERKIPRGYGFDLVSFPNYYFESLSWFAYFLIAQNWSALVFLIVGSGQMAIWAIKKHQRYRKEFGSKYPRNRKAMIPYLL